MDEENRRLAELDALRKGYEEEANERAAREQKLRREIESLREAGQQQLRSIASSRSQ